MKKTITLLSGLLLLAGASFLNGCKKNGGDGPVIEPPVIPGGFLYGGERLTTGAIIQLKYGEEVDLNSLITLEKPETEGSLAYTLVRQPSYSDVTTGNEYVDIEAWTLDGSKIKSVVPIPNVLYEGDVERQRKVLQARLRIELEGGVESEEVAPVDVFVVQTDKPALASPMVVPVGGDGYSDAPDGNGNKIRFVGASSGYTYFPRSLFTVLPIDYDPANIVIEPGPGATYIENSSNGIRTGGDANKMGAGEYILGFYCEPQGDNETGNAYQARLEAARQDAIESGAGRLYIDVVPAEQVVGIELATGIGTTNSLSFYRVAQKASTLFIVMKMADGTTRPYDSSKDSPLGFMAGEFVNIIGTTTSAVAGHPGWHTNVNPSPAPPVGSPIEFTITSRVHKLEPGWTVRVETEYLPAAPEQ